jgi:hypothetical protein
MARELYALLTPMPFCLPNDPGDTAVYICPVMAGQPVDTPLLTRMEQASIDMHFAHAKHYFLLMCNIKRACFTALDASVNDAFKVSNDPMIQGWHAGMRVINILDQLSTIYNQSTPVVLKTNNTVFCSPYLAANAPEDLFCQIKECAKMALLGCNPYTDHQLVTNAIRILLMTGLYTRPFEDWDRLTLTAQTWIALQTMIQEAFQQRLNVTAPTAGHQGYAPAMPHQQNTFRILGQNKSDDNLVETLPHKWWH